MRKINEFVAAGHLKETKYRHVRIEEIGIDHPLDLASKLDRTPAFLGRLMAHGQAQAGRFLKQRGRTVPS